MNKISFLRFLWGSFLPYYHHRCFLWPIIYNQLSALLILASQMPLHKQSALLSSASSSELWCTKWSGLPRWFSRISIAMKKTYDFFLLEIYLCVFHVEYYYHKVDHCLFGQLETGKKKKKTSLVKTYATGLFSPFISFGSFVWCCMSHPWKMLPF